ncbi:M23 family metallopeptidase [Sporosarcina sp. ITBMC105]
MQFVKPCEGYITSLYSSARLNPVTNKGVRPHWGIDYGSATNNKIWAAASGYVRYIGWGHATAGNYIVIRHPNGWETAYLHLQTIAVSTKQYVSQSQYIGMKGSTGNSTGVHLHFEMSKGTWPGGYANHVNPALYIIDSTVKVVQEQLNRLGFATDCTADREGGDHVGTQPTSTRRIGECVSICTRAWRIFF